MVPKELFSEHIFSSAEQGATLLGKTKFIGHKIRPASPLCQSMNSCEERGHHYVFVL